MQLVLALHVLFLSVLPLNMTEKVELGLRKSFVTLWYKLLPVSMRASLFVVGGNFSSAATSSSTTARASVVFVIIS